MAQPKLCNVCGQNVAIQSQLHDTRQGLVRRYFCAACASVSIDDVVNYRNAAIHELNEIPATFRLQPESAKPEPEQLREVMARIDEIAAKIASVPSPLTHILYERPFGHR